MVASGTELAKHAVSEGPKAMAKFRTCAPPASEFGINCDNRPWVFYAGLQFPVLHIKNILSARTGCRVSVLAAVYLAAVLEYWRAEIVELSGNEARDLCKQNITPHHVLLAVRKDEELGFQFKTCMWHP